MFLDGCGQLSKSLIHIVAASHLFLVEHQTTESVS
jgi:hypothetical protein